MWTAFTLLRQSLTLENTMLTNPIRRLLAAMTRSAEPKAAGVSDGLAVRTGLRAGVCGCKNCKEQTGPCLEQ